MSCDSCCEKISCRPEPCCEADPTVKSTVQRKMRDTRIEQVDNGYVVRCGCQELVVLSKSALINLLTMYINDPGETEDKYYKKELKFV
jgi:hypothetical protein